MIIAATISTLGDGINYVAVAAAAVGAFVLGALWYSPLLFGKEWMKLRGAAAGTVADARPSPGLMAAEFVRGFKR